MRIPLNLGGGKQLVKQIESDFVHRRVSAPAAAAFREALAPSATTSKELLITDSVSVYTPA